MIKATQVNNIDSLGLLETASKEPFKKGECDCRQSFQHFYCISTTDKDIVWEFQTSNINQVETDDEDADPGAQNFITANEEAAALKTMQQFLMQQDNASRALSNLEGIDTFVGRCYLKKLQQKSITAFFKKQYHV